MNDNRDVELVRKAGTRVSLVMNKVTSAVHSNGLAASQEVVDEALQAINHKGLHVDWNLFRIMVGVDPV